MASPAATLLAAFNGKSNSTPGNNYGGYNPFGGSSGQSSGSNDPGSQAQGEVAQSQSAYYGQQNANRAQLATDLQPYSIGGGVQQNANGASQNTSDPFATAVNAITQRGVDATNAEQAASQNAWNQRLGALNSDFQKNNADANQWLTDTMGQMQQQTQNGSLLGFDQLGQLIPTGADPNSNAGARAVAIAKQVVANGTPYLYGGNSLTAGVDCSGLVQQVYGRLGIQLPRTSTEQARSGKIVPSLQQAMPGDLILEYSPYEPQGLQQFGHVGIYLGNGLVIEAPGTGKNVRIGPIVNMTRIVRPW